MSQSFTSRKRIRKNFGKVSSVIDMPNLIEVQKSSYEQFLQMDIKAKDRTDTGLQEVFKSVFPIKDFTGHGELEFVKYEFDEPKYDVDECLQRDLTYSAPLRATLRLVVWDIDEETKARSIRDIKEQEVYMGDIPMMTENGTFVINGTERVVVSQMHRSPGVFFDHDGGKSHSSGKYLFSTRVIPYRGSWLDFVFDAKDLVHVRIDMRRKLPVTTFLYALDSAETEKARKEAEKKGKTLDPSEIKGMNQEEILSYFYEKVIYTKDKKGWKTPFETAKFKGIKLVHNLVDAKTGKVVCDAGTKMTTRVCDKLVKEGLKDILVAEDELIGLFGALDLVNMETGEIFLEAGEEITKEKLDILARNKIDSLSVLYIDHVNVGPYIRNTLVADKNANREEALIDIYKIMRPGEPPTVETASYLFNSLFFDNSRYDLSAVGRVKMNARLDIKMEESPENVRVLTKEDILRSVKTLVDLKDGRGEVDDIDHLGNRRVRSVGELMENQYRMGLVRMERTVRERMSSVDIDSVMPQDLFNAKSIVAAIREFFGSSQLSQFMDQNNPLSEITHKRRLSSLGPGGLTRERAGFEVRDVHLTHYGRICPIETPEGPNIGLINSLATYARVNQYGFIETPYRKVVNRKVTDEVVYMSALEEGKYVIAQANSELNAKGEFEGEQVAARKNGEGTIVNADEVDYIDVSPKQLVSAAAALIPFLENDDANRALMGSNMQRQAVPLMKTDAPFVGTGMEEHIAKDSGATITARRDGIVLQVDGTRIVVKATGTVSASDSGVDIYNLAKFQRSNQSTCINQKPIVKVGDKVKTNDIIADGASIDTGELALGRNVLVAFMPWNGYNYEDSILISERIVKEDVFTSIHIEEFEVMARDTKLGQEEITRDIPNVGEENLKQLDEAGIVYIGAEVKAGDILVGKVTPKGETQMSPEEKLLRAIFGEKAADVRDTSLRVPPGVSGTIVDVRMFNRRGIEKDERSKSIEFAEIEKKVKDRDAEKAILETNYYDRLEKLLIGKTVAGKKSTAKAKKDEAKAGDKITEKYLADIAKFHWSKIAVTDDKAMTEIEELTKTFENALAQVQKRFEKKVEKIQAGDEMTTGVLKAVKVFIAVKRKLQPGDKMAGRHGNKGVVSRVVPIEDMPYTEDGTPVDLVLNPLGVPSRMNIGQILETHLGWACKAVGKQIGEIVSGIKTKNATEADLKSKLKALYNKEEYAEVEKMNSSELMELAGNLSNGVTIATPVFDGAKEKDISDMLSMAGLDNSGQVTLFDGRTGEEFDRKVTIGYIYMLKLHHLVDEKIHARSVGPYSLVTQQPLGGKAQFGGQRFGEMEVWALEAYGAAYTLQEILTVKSDDVAGRTRVYEAIVRGDDNFEAGTPESFNVLMKEIRSLGLNIELTQKETE